MNGRQTSVSTRHPYKARREPAAVLRHARCMNQDPSANPRKVAFRTGILKAMREHPTETYTKQELIDRVRELIPEQFDDQEHCYPGCDTRHPKWRHEFDRVVYDLSSSIPPHIHNLRTRPPSYKLARRGETGRV